MARESIRPWCAVMGCYKKAESNGLCKKHGQTVSGNNKSKHPDDGIYPVWKPNEPQKAMALSIVKKIERTFELKQEAIQLLDLINAEWQSDPMSVQCFDSRIVERTDKLLKELKEMGEFLK